MLTILQFKFCAHVEMQLLTLCAVLLKTLDYFYILSKNWIVKMKCLQLGDFKTFQHIRSNFKTMQNSIFGLISLTLTVMISCIIFFVFWGHHQLRCLLLHWDLLLFTFIFVIILWFGFVYSKKTETLIHQIEGTLGNQNKTEKTSLHEKNTTTRKYYANNIY